ncbi:hypothetical protein HY522_10620 [bacterium]|nr:hypothetical protein [bacterium]
MKSFGYFLQVIALILLPSVFVWALMGKIGARTELSMLAAGAILFYAGNLCSKRKS